MSGKDPIATAMTAIVEAGKLAGAATLVWRDGEVVQTAVSCARCRVHSTRQIQQCARSPSGIC
jgi:hypothetical protein